MDTLSYKTISANKETAQKEWVVVDATDQVLGRLCTKVAKLLRGKYKPNFTPHVDCGDNVIIINADKVRLTGKSGQTVFTIPIPVILVVSANTLLQASWLRKMVQIVCSIA